MVYPPQLSNSAISHLNAATVSACGDCGAVTGQRNCSWLRARPKYWRKASPRMLAPKANQPISGPYVHFKIANNTKALNRALASLASFVYLKNSG
jgi:hypothetical protein